MSSAQVSNQRPGLTQIVRFSAHAARGLLGLVGVANKLGLIRLLLVV